MSASHDNRVTPLAVEHGPDDPVLGLEPTLKRALEFIEGGDLDDAKASIEHCIRLADQVIAEPDANGLCPETAEYALRLLDYLHPDLSGLVRAGGTSFHGNEQLIGDVDAILDVFTAIDTKSDMLGDDTLNALAFIGRRLTGAALGRCKPRD